MYHKDAEYTKGGNVLYLCVLCAFVVKRKPYPTATNR